MSIRADAYEVCKTIRDLPCCIQTRQIIHRLNATDFGYMARGLKAAQVLGYLILYQNRERFAEISILNHSIPMSKEEQQLLHVVHSQIVTLNTQCTAPLTSKLPGSAKAIDPYNKFQYASSLKDATMDARIIEAFDKMATSFQQHPAITIALNSPEPITNIPESTFTEGILQMTDRILQKGALESPLDLFELIHTEKPDSVRRLTLRHLVALMSIRSSLATLDQLAYQAMLYGRLAVLNEDNIIDIRGPVGHISSRGLSIAYQPDEKTGFFQLGNLVLVKWNSSRPVIDWLCQVEKTHLEFSRDFGQTVELRTSRN